MDFANPAEYSVTIKEREKINKYYAYTRKLKRQWNMRVTMSIHSYLSIYLSIYLSQQLQIYLSIIYHSHVINVYIYIYIYKVWNEIQRYQ